MNFTSRLFLRANRADENNSETYPFVGEILPNFTRHRIAARLRMLLKPKGRGGAARGTLER